MTITSTCDLETSFLSFTCTILSWRILRKEICFEVWSLKDNHFHFLKINAFFLVLQRQSLLLSHNKFCLQNDIQVLGRLSLSLSQKNIFSRVREWYGSDCVCKHWGAAGIAFFTMNYHSKDNSEHQIHDRIRNHRYSLQPHTRKSLSYHHQLSNTVWRDILKDMCLCNIFRR